MKQQTRNNTVSTSFLSFFCWQERDQCQAGNRMSLSLSCHANHQQHESRKESEEESEAESE